MPSDIILNTTYMGDVTIVQSLTPSAKSVAQLNREAMPTNAMKAYRETLTTACSFCHKSQKDKLVCAKVHFAHVCSWSLTN